MGWGLFISTVCTCAIIFVVLQPIYHHKNATLVVLGLLLIYLAFSGYNFFYGDTRGDMMSFAVFFATSLSFLAQLRYSHQVKTTHGFYPRVFYKRHPIRGVYIKHPDIERAHSEPDTIMTILAFAGMTIGFFGVLCFEIALRV
ncbi:hypothetical protein NM22_06900 [Vibrio tubiashii]|nr:hypothetical protein NM22_06900 [Vibrio tubiashii]